MVDLLTELERPLIFQKYYTFLRFKNIHACYCYHHSLFIYIVWRLLIYIYIYIYLQINPNTKLDKTKFWPNLFRQNQNKIFWRHEYDKHASCISPFQNDHDKYFSSTLKLAMDSKIGNVTTMLLKAGSIYLYRHRLYS